MRDIEKESFAYYINKVNLQLIFRASRGLRRSGRIYEERPLPVYFSDPARADSKDVQVVDFYLVRHGDAVSELVDIERPLSSSGRDQAAQVAGRAAEKHARPVTIYHSGILRARQTAEILSEQLHPAGGVLFMDGLQPLEDPAGAAAELATATDSMMLVGHLPFMNRLAAMLVCGDPERLVVDFSPATLVCLSYSGSRWNLQWFLTP